MLPIRAAPNNALVAIGNKIQLPALCYRSRYVLFGLVLSLVVHRLAA